MYFEFFLGTYSQIWTNQITWVGYDQREMLAEFGRESKRILEFVYVSMFPCPDDFKRVLLFSVMIPIYRRIIAKTSYTTIFQNYFFMKAF